MTETPDELLLVELISGHFHPPHLDHLLVELEQVLLGSLYLEPWHVMLVDLEGLLGELDLERLGSGGRRGIEGRGRVGCDMNEARGDGGGGSEGLWSGTGEGRHMGHKRIMSKRTSSRRQPR